MKSLDADSSGLLNREEAAKGLLPADYAMIDRDSDGFLSRIELEIAVDIAAEQLPNLAIPEMDSVGAMELPVSVAAGVCDFISSMDTARIAEWNMWYHILNCGYPLKVSGETDFPCMSGTAVGQGRTYAFLGDVDHIRFQSWCDALAAGRSYVSDGYAHAFETKVHTASSIVEVGDTLQLPQPATITLTSKVAFAPRTPETVAQGTRLVEGRRRFSGDTVTLHGTTIGRWGEGGKRRVDVVVNGNVVASQEVVADGQLHDLSFEIPIERSSWVALRCFPSLHTNPIDVQISNKPIRASASSARWCEETIHQLWSKRENNIRNEEREDAKREFQKAIEAFQLRGRESQAP
jgi:hypothetical protein